MQPLQRAHLILLLALFALCLVRETPQPRGAQAPQKLGGSQIGPLCVEVIGGVSLGGLTSYLVGEFLSLAGKQRYVSYWNLTLAVLLGAFHCSLQSLNTTVCCFFM